MNCAADFTDLAHRGEPADEQVTIFSIVPLEEFLELRYLTSVRHPAHSRCSLGCLRGRSGEISGSTRTTGAPSVCGVSSLSSTIGTGRSAGKPRIITSTRGFPPLSS